MENLVLFSDMELVLLQNQLSKFPEDKEHRNDVLKELKKRQLKRNER